MIFLEYLNFNGVKIGIFGSGILITEGDGNRPPIFQTQIEVGWTYLIPISALNLWS